MDSLRSTLKSTVFLFLYSCSKTFGILHRMLCYQKRCRVRLSYSWKNFWTALMNFLKFLLSNETVLTKTCDIFSLASQVRLQLNLLLFPFRDDEFDGGIC